MLSSLKSKTRALADIDIKTKMADKILDIHIL